MWKDVGVFVFVQQLEIILMLLALGSLLIVQCCVPYFCYVTCRSFEAFFGEMSTCNNDLLFSHSLARSFIP